LQLCASLGVTLNRFELETALFVLDKDASGLIDKIEFVSWFRDNGTSLINN
jgi:Ca2+-binding EF-hand superfamily protein